MLSGMAFQDGDGIWFVLFLQAKIPPTMGLAGNRLGCLIVMSSIDNCILMDLFSPPDVPMT